MSEEMITFQFEVHIEFNKTPYVHEVQAATGNDAWALIGHRVTGLGNHDATKIKMISRSDRDKIYHKDED